MLSSQNGFKVIGKISIQIVKIINRLFDRFKMGFVEKKVKKRIADDLQPSGDTFLRAVWQAKRLDPALNPVTFNFKAPDGARRCSPGEHRALN
jgi:hypothetical protein